MQSAMLFPTEETVEAAAAAVLQILRSHKHIYGHSLRYLPQRSQLEAARRMAKAALWTVWQHSGDPLESLAQQVAERARALVAEAERSRSPMRRDYEGVEHYKALKAKYQPK